jgi:prepilin-type N-terminal cleavage/methylation domain-containing protein
MAATQAKESSMLAKLQERRGTLTDEGGFTLIELLVVLIIIGVLLAIAIPSYLGFRDKAQRTAAASDVREAIPSAEAYYSDNNTYATMTAGALQSTYDKGMKIVGSPATQTDGIVKAVGGATTYCISAQEGTHFAHVVGPGGNVVDSDSADYCTATYVAS